MDAGLFTSPTPASIGFESIVAIILGKTISILPWQTGKLPKRNQLSTDHVPGQFRVTERVKARELLALGFGIKGMSNMGR
jgi:hypothetical protein